MEVSKGKLTVEEVIQWTPLRFAEEICSWAWVEKFLQEGVPVKDLEATRRKLKCVDSAANIVRDACASGLLELLKFVLSMDSSLANITLDRERTTPLHIAVAHRRIAVVRMLGVTGADVNAKTSRGQTPLHTAALLGSEPIVHILLGLGANVWELDQDGKSADQFAMDNGHLDVAKLLEFHSGKITKSLWDLVTAANSGDVEAVRRLLKLNPSKEPGEWTALHWGTMKGTPTMVRTYLAAGLNPNVTDRHGNTPLHIAAARRPAAFSTALIAGGADIDAADCTGSTALHYAVRTGNTPAVCILLEAGARTDVRDSDGDTPLHRGVSRMSLEAVSVLLEAGARRDVRDARGETPYELARRLGSADLLRMLRLTPSGWRNGQ